MAHYNLKWTDEAIMKYLVETFLSRGRLTVSNRDIYADLRRRVQRGEFGSVKEAMERLWFRGLVVANSDFIAKNCPLWWAAKWLVDTANNGNAKSVKRLNRLIGSEEEKMGIVLKEIFRPCYPAAQNIVRLFVASRTRGKKLRILISTMGLN